MPFAFIGFFLAVTTTQHQFDWRKLVLMVLCMVFARNSAMAFNRYFDANQQHKLKIVKYPEAPTESDDPIARQGVGPHKDSMLTSYLLQATGHRGLQVQNVKGEWIDCPPIDGTLVVAMGQGLEALTQGVCVSTTHRVLSPAAGSGPAIAAFAATSTASST